MEPEDPLSAEIPTLDQHIGVPIPGGSQSRSSVRIDRIPDAKLHSLLGHHLNPFFSVDTSYLTGDMFTLKC